VEPGPFQGRTLRTLEAGGVLVSENAYAARSALSRHVHGRAFLSLTLAGGYVERHGTRDVDYGTSSIAFHPAGEEHSVAIGTADVQCLNIEVRDEWLDLVAGAGGSQRSFVRAVGGPLAWLAHGLLGEARAWSASSTLAVESAVLEMLAILGAAPSPTPDRLPPRWLDRAEEILRTEYRSPLTVASLAARVGVHPVHLSRTWRRFRRSSLGDALRRLRIEEARRRLAGGTESLVGVALDLGFGDQAHFTRVFRRVTGLTPRAYRRQARGLH
jgi:AraC family transcriptional regulator